MDGATAHACGADGGARDAAGRGPTDASKGGRNYNKPDAVVVVSEEAMQSVSPVDQVTAPNMGRTQGDTAEGSPGVVVVVERTSGGSPLALTSRGSRSPTRGESLL